MVNTKTALPTNTVKNNALKYKKLNNSGNDEQAGGSPIKGMGIALFYAC
ncbi:hypothetical protein [Dickeya lacustris]|uniref:Uncharacterized protein n=1 Tax=Dickeya lacustris TaxID=2259638 RepID=A0ABY8G6M6_9GAMM|nr:hypothetical protein [Dickeya lacustris]WFN55617.1 hypothetical protein O1Q98_18905 [Dickeya lacustris]